MKSMISRRLDRANSLLRELSADFLTKETGETLITISRLETAKGLKKAKIFISIFPESKEGEILKLLRGKLPELRNFIGSRIKMKFLPSLEIEIDNQGKAERKIEELLKIK